MATSLSCIVWKAVSLSQSQVANQMRIAWRPTPTWFLVAIVLMASPSIAASSARFVPGEVIVQFAPGSESHRVVAQASRQPAPDLADFAPIVTRLTTATNIPLSAKQLLSGQRLLLGIDTNRIIDKKLVDVDLSALTHLAIQQLSALSEIANAQPNYRSSIRTPEP
jgi:hypothetical protein